MKNEKVDRKDETAEPEYGKKEAYPDICVCCGVPVPEGRMICWNCEQEFDYGKTEMIFRHGKTTSI